MARCEAAAVLFAAGERAEVGTVAFARVVDGVGEGAEGGEEGADAGDYGEGWGYVDALGGHVAADAADWEKGAVRFGRVYTVCRDEN